MSDLGVQYARARSEWIDQAHARLVADERVGAAMLSGSLGRGGGDAWSDVDLLVVLCADAAAQTIAARDAFVRPFGTALVAFDSPWNAPLDGGQVNALYDVGVDWLLYVDWDLWPAGRGAITSDVFVLFDRIDLPTFDGTLDEHRQWPRAPWAEPTPEFMRRARLAMLPIILKCMMRGDAEQIRRMLDNLGAESPRALWDMVRTDCDRALRDALDRMMAVAS
jgi:predicted nucleotidyltransferase